jgi:hypothetical protein
MRQALYRHPRPAVVLSSVLEATNAPLELGTPTATKKGIAFRVIPRFLGRDRGDGCPSPGKTPRESDRGEEYPSAG